MVVNLLKNATKTSVLQKISNFISLKIFNKIKQNYNINSKNKKETNYKIYIPLNLNNYYNVFNIQFNVITFSDINKSYLLGGIVHSYIDKELKQKQKSFQIQFNIFLKNNYLIDLQLQRFYSDIYNVINHQMQHISQKMNNIYIKNEQEYTKGMEQFADSLDMDEKYIGFKNYKLDPIQIQAQAKAVIRSRQKYLQDKTYNQILYKQIYDFQKNKMLNAFSHQYKQISEKQKLLNMSQQYADAIIKKVREFIEKRACNWYSTIKISSEINNFSDRNDMNLRIRNFKKILQDTKYWQKLCDQDAPKVQKQIKKLINLKQMSSFPKILQALSIADKKILDSRQTCKNALKKVQQILIIEIKKMTKTRDEWVRK